jgi:hypothetical protein
MGLIPAETLRVIHVEVVHALVQYGFQDRRMLAERAVHRCRAAALSADDQEARQHPSPAGHPPGGHPDSVDSTLGWRGDGHGSHHARKSFLLMPIRATPTALIGQQLRR